MKKLLFGLLLTTCVSLPVVATTSSNQFTTTQTQELHKIIHDYLVQNPQVLIEASQTLQAQQQQRMESAAIKAVAQNKQALFGDSNSPSLGAANAKTTLVEFFDYQCGHCRAMAPTIEKVIANDKSLRVIFKELPIFGGNSKYAAKAALAAAKQGKYYAFHNALLAVDGPLSQSKIMTVAKSAGLNVAKLKAAMNSPSIEKQLRNNFQLAQTIKLVGTPTFVISNQAQTKFQFIPGATSPDGLAKAIQAVQ